jgi:hypothetical protein
MRALYAPLGFRRKYVSGSCVSDLSSRKFAGLALTGSCSEIRCCNKAAHMIRRHRATDKKTETSNSEVVIALLIQDIQKYQLARRLLQLIGTFRRNVKSPYVV